MTQLLKIDRSVVEENDFGRKESLALKVELAARTIAPLWPLEGAIAVNPLSGFEDQSFDEAARSASRLFKARAALPLPIWRRLSAEGRPDKKEVRRIAISRLGGLNCAFRMVGPDISLLDCMMALLFEVDFPGGTNSLPDRPAEAIAELCAAYFDTGISVLSMPGRERGLYMATRDILAHHKLFRSGRETILKAPTSPLAATRWALETLAIPPNLWSDYIIATLARLPGWAGHIRWRSEHADRDVGADAPATAADLIALLLLGDCALGINQLGESEDVAFDLRNALAEHFDIRPEVFTQAVENLTRFDQTALSMVFQCAAERSYGDQLGQSIEREARKLPVEPKPDVQLAFCIDVRSEPMRRAIETKGSYQTIGYAGFFGLPIAIRPPSGERIRQLPVLVEPQHELLLAPASGAENQATSFLAARKRSSEFRGLFGRLKNGAATTFATAEVTGPLAGFLMLLRTMFPRMSRRLAKWWSGDESSLAPSIDRLEGSAGLSAEERLAYARSFVALTGVEPQSKLVVFVGHRGEAVNNPYASTLDCGACAGHSGGPNARAMAAIFNDTEVKRALGIPRVCWFLAAEHNTTTDEITLFETHLAPTTHKAALAALQADLGRASDEVRRSRAGRLGCNVNDLALGAGHWGEVRPEWGLANNAGFLVGPRWLTKNLDLEGRAFLHDYDWRADPDGEALATILTAPMVVAQWINCQYLFSTIDNDRYGSGDKTIHNAVGRVGVVRGNGGDLAVGLPRQSLFRDDGMPEHLPQRLTTVVYAPYQRVEAVIHSQAVLSRLFGNGWVRLIVVDPETGTAWRWLGDETIKASGK